MVDRRVCHLLPALLDRAFDGRAIVPFARFEERVNQVGHTARDPLESFFVVQPPTLAALVVRLRQGIVQNCRPRSEVERTLEAMIAVAARSMTFAATGAVASGRGAVIDRECGRRSEPFDTAGLANDRGPEDSADTGNCRDGLSRCR